MQSLQASCVLDSGKATAPLWAGLGRAPSCGVTGEIMVPGRGKEEEGIMKRLGLSSSLLLAWVKKISVQEGGAWQSLAFSDESYQEDQICKKSLQVMQKVFEIPTMKDFTLENYFWKSVYYLNKHSSYLL